MTQNSTRFITAFNRIEKKLVSIVGAKEYLPFYKLIQFGKKNSAVIRRYEADLREYGDLRNAIVHDRTSVEFAIAEPHEDVVKALELIEEELSKPVTVGQKFMREVHTFKTTDTLSYVLKTIKEKKYTQFPVYENEKFKGLVTTFGITYFLAENITKEVISQEMTTLKDIIQHEEVTDHYQFIRKDATVYETEEIYREAIGKRNRLEALLITQNGKETEKLLGIITPWDLIEIEL